MLSIPSPIILSLLGGHFFGVLACYLLTFFPPIFQVFMLLLPSFSNPWLSVLHIGDMKLMVILFFSVIRQWEFRNYFTGVLVQSTGFYMGLRGCLVWRKQILFWKNKFLENYLFGLKEIFRNRRCCE